MFGGLRGLSALLLLIADLARMILRARKKKAARESYEAIESDPAGEFIDRYGMRDPESGESDASASKAGTRERN